MRVILVFVSFLLAAPAMAEANLKTDKGLAFSQWLPAGFSARHHDVPLILFSHGFGGCSQQSRTLTAALAEAGYAVLAPDHKDEGCERWKGGIAGRLMSGMERPPERFLKPENWHDTTARDRRDDMEALLDYALAHEPYQGAIDPDHIAAMGHSLGGYTALGLGGAWTSWRDPRIKAVLALSPYAAPFVSSKTLGDVAVPVMYQTGTRDIGIGPVLIKNGGYDMTAAPKYLVEFQGAGHFAWTELNPKYQKDIAAYAIAFLDKVLLGKTAPLLDGRPLSRVALYRHQP
ncbi:MAG TPA: alpha/beta hydrolase [Rhizomicrobium sp.]|nr:alpha/beta hydrolase [Rhizomicrobium sp.]